MERRVPLRAGCARAPPGHHPRHGADRDDPRRVRDGGNPLRAARAQRRPQRRTLGLHLQRHQEVPQPRGVGVARPGSDHDDGAVYAGLYGTAGPHLPRPRRPRHRRDGRVHPQSPRPRGQRPGARPGARGQTARVRRRIRRHLGRAPGPRPAGDRGIHRGAGRRPAPAAPPPRGGPRRRARAVGHPRPRRPGHRGRRGRERERRLAVPRQLVAGHRSRGDREPHGGHRDRRDLPRTVVAMGAAPLRAARRPRDRSRALPHHPAAGVGGPRHGGRRREAAELLDALVLASEFAEFLTLPAYRLLDAGPENRS